MGAIKCPKCDVELHGKFCSECGKEIVVRTKEDIENEVKSVKESCEKTTERWKTFCGFELFIIIGLLCVIFGGYVGRMKEYVDKIDMETMKAYMSEFDGFTNRK